MNLNIRAAFKAVILLAAILALAQGKCKNSTTFKYDLKEASELVGYHSLCSEYAKRTCCSASNFDFLAKRYTCNEVGWGR
jgi:hypothetical protein